MNKQQKHSEATSGFVSATEPSDSCSCGSAANACRDDLIQKIKQARKEYQTIFDLVPAMIWYRDRQGRILKVNQTAADSVGASIRDLVGKNYYDLFPDGAQRARQQDIEVMETGKPLYRQLRQFVDMHGQTRWALVDRIPLRGQDGKIDGVMVFAVDITDQKKAEAQLLQAQQEIEQMNRRLKASAEQARLLAQKAQRSNKIKSEILASSSHDLRTPMNSIIGFAELLLDTTLDDEQKDYVRTIHQAASSLLALINDILDFSKIEAGKMKIEILPCCLRDLLKNIHSLMAMAAHKKGLALSIDCDPRVPEQILIDPTRLQQCLINLVGNAVKFTQKGQVFVKVFLDQCADQTCIRFDVSDTGIGIPEDKQEIIFKSFSQAELSTARQYGGTGLGLAITRRLVELMGGFIRLQSKVGVGSTFTIILPLAEPNCPSTCAPRRQRANRRREIRHPLNGRILLAEAAVPSQLTMTLMLRRLGLDVQTVYSLAEMREALNPFAPDIALLDEKLCGGDIEGAAASLKAAAPNLAIVALSDNDHLSQNKPDAIDGVLVRPVFREQIFCLLETLLANRAPAPQKPQHDVLTAENLMDDLPALIEGLKLSIDERQSNLANDYARLLIEIGQIHRHAELVQAAEELARRLEKWPENLEAVSRQVQTIADLCQAIAAPETTGGDVKP